MPLSSISLCWCLFFLVVYATADKQLGQLQMKQVINTAQENEKTSPQSPLEATLVTAEIPVNCLADPFVPNMVDVIVAPLKAPPVTESMMHDGSSSNNNNNNNMDNTHKDMDKEQSTDLGQTSAKGSLQAPLDASSSSSQTLDWIRLKLAKEPDSRSHDKQELIVNGELVHPLQQQCFPCKKLTFFEIRSDFSDNPMCSSAEHETSDAQPPSIDKTVADLPPSDFNFTNTTDTVLPTLLPTESIDPLFVSNLISYFVSQQCISGECALEIVNRAFAIIDAEPNVNDLTIPENGKVTIVGDIHGQFFDLVSIFEIAGRPSPTNFIVVNGDFVDRGTKSVETLLSLLSLKILMPKFVFLNRGNHESATLNRVYGFQMEFFLKFKNNHLLYNRVQALFNRLPLACRIQSSVFVTHGGIGRHGNVTIQDMLSLNRTCDASERTPATPVNTTLIDLLWSDPRPENGFAPSDRKISVSFGPDITSEFLLTNNLSLIVRSHEVVKDGYELTHGDQIVTLFSAPNYESTGNIAAVMHLFSNLSYTFTPITPSLPRKQS